MHPRLTSIVVLLTGVVATTAIPAQPVRWPKGTVVVSNMNDATATVIDAETGMVRATLPTGNGPHEVAASHDGRWAVVTNYGTRTAAGNSMTLIDLATATVVRTIDLGEITRPHGVKFLPGDSMLVVTSERTQAVVLVSLSSDRIVRTLPTRGRTSHMIAITASGDRYFTANISDGSVSLIDPTGRDSTRVVPVSKLTEGIGAAPDGHRVWVGSNRDSIVVVVDPDGTTPPDTLRGFGLPYRIAVSPNGQLAVITDPARAEVRIVDAATHSTRATVVVPSDSLLATAEVPGSPSPEGVAISDDSRWAFVTLQGRNRVIWIDLERGLIRRSAPTGTWSDGVAFARAIARK
ncbi:MAG: hypothetical protein U0163_16510 [Gemmatimonadaceae bacterium]